MKCSQYNNCLRKNHGFCSLLCPDRHSILYKLNNTGMVQFNVVDCMIIVNIHTTVYLENTSILRVITYTDQPRDI